MQTYSQAIATLPAEAQWSCSFGNPGEGGYTEYHRTPDGRRFEIANGAYDAICPFHWTVRECSTPLSPSTVDVGTITEYGLTQKLQSPIRCF